MAETDTLPLVAETPALSEKEAAFDSKADWDADSGAHDPTEAGNDAVPEVAADEPAAENREPEVAPAAVEEPARNEQGQFVKKGKGKPRSDPQARVEQATAKEAAAKAEAQKAREEAEQLRARVAALEASRFPANGQRHVPDATPVHQSAVFPAFDKWLEQHPQQDWDAYNRELIRHEAQEQARAIAADSIQQWHQQQTLQMQVQSYQQRLAEGSAKLPDYQEVVEKANPVVRAGLAAHGLSQFPVILEAALVESTRPAEIIRDLALHPEDAIQLAVEVKDYPVSAAPMLRRLLESRLTAQAAASRPDSAPTAQPSAAKPPINRVGGSASATPIDPEDLDFGPEYIRAENERERKARAMGRW